MQFDTFICLLLQALWTAGAGRPCPAGRWLGTFTPLAVLFPWGIIYRNASQGNNPSAAAVTAGRASGLPPLAPAFFIPLGISRVWDSIGTYLGACKAQ